MTIPMVSITEELRCAMDALLQSSHHDGERVRILGEPSAILKASGLNPDLEYQLRVANIIVPHAQNGKGQYLELRVDHIDPTIHPDIRGARTPDRGAAMQKTDQEDANALQRSLPHDRIAVFMDFENASKHLEGIHDTFSVGRIREAIAPFGRIIVLEAYIDVTRTEPAIVHLLLDRGVDLIHCPKRGSRAALHDTVDGRMDRRIRKFVGGTDIPTIAIVTNDNDFLDVIQWTRDQRRRTILLVGDPDASLELQRAADICISIGSPILREIMLCVKELRRCSKSAAWPEDAFDTLAHRFPVAMGIFVEMIAYVNGHPNIAKGFAVEYLRKQLYGSSPHAEIPDRLSPEEALTVMCILRDLECFTPRPSDVADRDAPTGRLVLNHDHPFVSLALRTPDLAKTIFASVEHYGA